MEVPGSCEISAAGISVGKAGGAEGKGAQNPGKVDTLIH